MNTKIIIIKGLIAGLCFIACSFYAKAQQQDTIIFTWEARVANKEKVITVYTSPQELFTVYWGDGTSSQHIATDGSIYLASAFAGKTYADTGIYTVTVVGSPNKPIVRLYYMWTYEYVTYIDVSKCYGLNYLVCDYNRIRRIDVSQNGNPNLANNGGIECKFNSLPLSNCAELYGVGHLMGIPQNLETRTLAKRGDTIDFSSELWIKRYKGGTNDPERTHFVVYYDDSTLDTNLTTHKVTGMPVASEICTEKDGIFTFNKAGKYLIRMWNLNARSWTQNGGGDTAQVYQRVILLPNTDASLFNLSVSEGNLKPAFDSTVYDYTVEVPYNISSIFITATSSDTLASISGAGMKQLQTGSNVFSVIVTAEDGISTQTYTVQVNRATTPSNIKKQAVEEEETLHIYPNPTTGKLIIESGKLTINYVDFFDVTGKKLSQEVASSLSERAGGEVSLDISHLSVGTYFLEIHTDKGTIKRKIVKE